MKLQTHAGTIELLMLDAKDNSSAMKPACCPPLSTLHLQYQTRVLTLPIEHNTMMNMNVRKPPGSTIISDARHNTPQQDRDNKIEQLILRLVHQSQFSLGDLRPFLR